MSPDRRIDRRIFVVGVPRSGTTLVQSLLAAHDEVASWIESHFFDRLFRVVPGLPSRALLVHDPEPQLLDFFQTNDALWDDGEPIRWTDRRPEWRYRVPLVRSLWSDAAARSLVEIYDDLASCQGCSTWVEKTPAHLRYVPFLERLLADDDPELRFVHVIRDGLETVASLHAASKYWERAYGVDECVRRWNREMALSLRRVSRSDADSKRDVFVFYEELTSDPEAATRGLFEEVGLVWQPDVLEHYGRAASTVTADDESWKSGTGRAIEPSATSSVALTDEQRRRAERGLRRDLYRDLYDEVRRRARP